MQFMENKKILFVCMGNICRSPAAEAVMKHIVEREKLESEIFIDSAGTIGYHAGDPADARMISKAVKRGYDLTSISRKFNPDTDFDKFDYIVTMDNDNYEDIRHLDRKKKYRDKLFKMTSFNRNMKVSEVPDPYYSGSDGFELVLDILEDACEGLLNKVKDDIKQKD